MHKTQLLATIYAMRTNAHYQTAEKRRRDLNDVGAMARTVKTDADYGSVILLINTWEAISLLVLELEDEDKDFFFGSCRCSTCLPS